MHGKQALPLGEVLARGEFVNEQREDETHLRLNIAQRLYERTPLWQQYFNGTLEVHVHAELHGQPVCVEFAPKRIFRHMENARDVQVYTHRQDFAMLRGVVQVAKLARPLASFEWLKLANDCHVFLADSFKEARAPSRKALWRVLNKELGATLRRPGVVRSKNVDEVVERRPEVVRDLANQDARRELQWAENGAAWPPSLVKIFLGEHTVFGQLVDLSDDGFQIRQVFTCPRMSPDSSL